LFILNINFGGYIILIFELILTIIEIIFIVQKIKKLDQIVCNFGLIYRNLARKYRFLLNYKFNNFYIGLNCDFTILVMIYKKLLKNTLNIRQK
jgi:hypothetical protein